MPGVGVGAKEQIDGEHKFSFNQKRKILFLTKSKFGSRVGVFNFRRGERLLKGLKGRGGGERRCRVHLTDEMRQTTNVTVFAF